MFSCSAQQRERLAKNLCDRAEGASAEALFKSSVLIVRVLVTCAEIVPTVKPETCTSKEFPSFLVPYPLPAVEAAVSIPTSEGSAAVVATKPYLLVSIVVFHP